MADRSRRAVISRAGPCRIWVNVLRAFTSCAAGSGNSASSIIPPICITPETPNSSRWFTLSASFMKMK
jgi:hypothetical protein